MPAFRVPINVKHTFAPLSADEVILRKDLATGVTKIPAVAGRTHFPFESKKGILEGRIGVLITSRAVRISELVNGPRNMFTVLHLRHPDLGDDEQSWVAEGVNGRVKEVEPADTKHFLNALEDHYADLDSLPPSPKIGRLHIEAAGYHHISVLEAARLAVAGFAQHIMPL